MKKTIALLLAILMLCTLIACGGQPVAPAEDVQDEMRTFTDSLGREVDLPAEPDKIAVTGPLAQITVFALCPDKLVGVSNGWSDAAKEYIAAPYLTLPELGQLYGGKGDLNPEALLQSGAQVVIDVGEQKEGMAADLDALSEQTGIPFVHIDAMLEDLGTTYRLLGELTGMTEEAETLAAYCERVYDRAVTVAAGADKPTGLYITGAEGLNVIAAGSYHASVVDMAMQNAAVVTEPSSKGTGNEVDMEQLLNWNPDVIIFSPGSVFAAVEQDENWQHLNAIKNRTYYEVPEGPYNWMGFPPSVQRLLGLMWLEKLLYPDAADYDLKTEVQEYYQMFYHCDLTDGQYEALVQNSIGRVEAAS